MYKFPYMHPHIRPLFIQFDEHLQCSLYAEVSDGRMSYVRQQFVSKMHVELEHLLSCVRE